VDCPGGICSTGTELAITVAGGRENTATTYAATIGGGELNTASEFYATIGGGSQNTASGSSSTVPGGTFCAAGGDYSFAAGRKAKANHAGTFVWADSTDADFTLERDKQFRGRANGGARFDDGAQWVDIRDDGTNLITSSTGARLTLAGAWANASARELKEKTTSRSTGATF
jgi:hypothetical protein